MLESVCLEYPFLQPPLEKSSTTCKAEDAVKTRPLEEKRAVRGGERAEAATERAAPASLRATEAQQAGQSAAPARRPTRALWWGGEVPVQEHGRVTPLLLTLSSLIRTTWRVTPPPKVTVRIK